MAMIIFKMPRVGAPGTVVMILFATLTSIGCRDSAPEETTISRKGAFISKEDAFQVAVEYIEKHGPEWKDAREWRHTVTDRRNNRVVTFVVPEMDPVGWPVVHVDRKGRGVVMASLFSITEEHAFQAAINYIEKVRPDWKDALKLGHKVTDIEDYWIVTFEPRDNTVGGTPVLYVNPNRGRVVKAFQYDARRENTMSEEDAFQVAVEYIKKERPDLKEALTWPHKAIDIGGYWVVRFNYPQGAVGRPNVVFQVDKQRKRVVNAFRD
jgi:hypothetical protein